MTKLKQFGLVLFLGLIALIFFIIGHWEDGSREDAPLSSVYEIESTQADTVHNRNLLLISFRTSDEEMNEEDEWAVDTELEIRKCEKKTHTTPIPLELKYRQYGRKKRIHDLCDNNGTLGINEKWHSVDEIPISELSNLLVDDRHGIIYCYVPKVACTEWKRIMIVLSESLKVDGVPYRRPSDIPEEQIHGNITQYLNQYPREVMKHKLQHYKKFLFVRDPFVRLISAFRDKFLKENQPFYKYVVVDILKRFGNISNPPASAKKAFAAGIVPSFSNFIQYILSLPEGNYTLLDEHWRQAAHLCHPCLIEYDFIGKMETVEEDAAQLLRMLQVDNIIQFPKSRSNITDESWIKIWFPDIPTDWRRNLYNIYERDYILFGYRHPEDLLHT